MKIIISRKGFDGGRGAGACASPIIRLDNGSWACRSLPIPNGRPTCAYTELTWGRHNLGELVNHLHGLDGSTGAHLDPDLAKDLWCNRPHADGWRPAFGQNRINDEGHLRQNGVGGNAPGDCAWDRPSKRPLFLFFGWFKQAEFNQHWQFVGRGDGIHAFWGWLQPERKLDLAPQRRAEILRDSGLSWLHDHAHVRGENGQHYDAIQPNAVYVAPLPGSACDRLYLCDKQTDLPAAGVFNRLDAKHVLSSQGRTKSQWALPQLNTAFSQFNDQSWSESCWLNTLTLNTHIGHWQECVLEGSGEAQQWALEIIKSGVANA